MSNLLDPTIVQDARIWQDDAGSKMTENRPTNSHALDAVLLSSNSLISPTEFQNIKKSGQQPTKIQSWVKQNLELKNHKSETIAGITNQTQIDDITVVTISAMQTLRVKELINNDRASIVEHVGRMLQNMERSIIVDGVASGTNGTTSLEDQILAYLDTNRSHVNLIGNGSKNTWVTGSYEYWVAVAAANRARYWNLMKADFKKNNYSPDNILHVINSEFDADWDYYRNQGAGNTANTQFQFGGHTVTSSSKLEVESAGHDGIDYAFVPGAIGIVNWCENMKVPQGTFAGQYNYGVHDMKLSMPITGQIPFRCDLVQYQTVADTTSVGGARQDQVIAFEMALTVGLIKPKHSVAGATDIFKYVQLNA
jgi:hypothetical protein